MNTKITCLALAATLLAGGSPILAQGTSFTYQGRLTAGGVPQSGSYDLTFTLYDAATGGSALAGPLTNSAATGTDGVFTVKLDFGGAVFDGLPRWLQVGVRPANTGAFSPLSPRQALTASPYAFFAASPQGPAGTPGSVWREGSGVPTGNPGIDGDFYLNGTNGDVYQRAAGTYAVVANIKGVQGPSGVAIPFRGVGLTNIALFEADNAGTGNGLSGMTGTGYGVFGQANAAGGWGGLFRYSSDGNNSAYLGANGSAGVFYGNVGVNGATGGTLLQANNSGSGGVGVAIRGNSPGCGAYGELGVASGASPNCSGVYGNGGAGGSAGLFDGPVQINGAINSGEIYAYNTNGDGYGVKGYGNNIGVFADNTSSGIAVYLATTGLAGDFYGNVYVHGTVTQTSDRNAKENFTPVDSGEILDKIARLPLESWNYKGEPECRHVGPMAQDFRKAFALGLDDKSICSVDADGVALAAIQALNQKIEQKDAEIQTLKQRLDAIERSLH